MFCIAGSKLVAVIVSVLEFTTRINGCVAVFCGVLLSVTVTLNE